MAINEKNMTKVYNALVNKMGASAIGTYDQYVNQMQDESKRKKVYDALKDLDLGTYDTFNKQLGFVNEDDVKDPLQMAEQNAQQTMGAGAVATKNEERKTKDEGRRTKDEGQRTEDEGGRGVTEPAFMGDIRDMVEKGQHPMYSPTARLGTNADWMGISLEDNNQPYAMADMNQKNGSGVDGEIVSYKDFEKAVVNEDNTINEEAYYRLKDNIDPETVELNEKGITFADEARLMEIASRTIATNPDNITPEEQKAIEDAKVEFNTIANEILGDGGADKFAAYMKKKVITDLYNQVSEQKTMIDGKYNIFEQMLGKLASGVDFMAKNGSLATRIGYAAWGMALPDKVKKDINDLMAYSVAEKMLEGSNEKLNQYNIEQLQDAAEKQVEDKYGWAAGKALGALHAVYNASKGSADILNDLGTYDFGITDLGKMNMLKNAAEKADAGMELTDAEQAILDAAALNLAVEIQAETGMAYEAGGVLGQSIPLLLQMAVNPLAGAGKGVANKVAKYAAKKAIANYATKLGTKVTAALAKGGTQLTLDALKAGGMALTTGSASTMANTLEREMGDIQYMIDDEGRIRYAGRENQEDEWEAFFKAFASQSIEYQSEMMGEYLSKLLKPLYHTPAGMLWKNNPEMYKRMYRMMQVAKPSAIMKLKRRTFVNGLPGEVAEEFIGGTENAIIVQDDDLAQVWSWDNLVTTTIDMIPMQVAFGLIGMGWNGAQNGVHYMEAKNYESKQKAHLVAVMGEDKLEAINSMIDNANEGKVGEALQNYADAEELNEEEKIAIARYSYARMQRKGVELADKIDAMNNVNSMVYGAAYRNGAEMKDGQDVALVVDRFKECFDEMKSNPNVSMFIDMVRDNAANAVEYAHANARTADGVELLSAADLNAIENFATAYMTMQGAKDALASEYKDRRNMNHAIVKETTHKDGKIHPVKLLNGTEVYVVNGDITSTEDGYVDRNKSSKQIIVYDPLIGKKRTASASEIDVVGKIQDPTTQLKATDAALEEEINTAWSALASGQLTGKADEKVHLLNSESNEWMGGTIVSTYMDNDGVVIANIEMEDGTMTIQSMQQLQAAADMYRQEKLNAMMGENKLAVMAESGVATSDVATSDDALVDEERKTKDEERRTEDEERKTKNELRMQWESNGEVHTGTFVEYSNHEQVRVLDDATGKIVTLTREEEESAREIEEEEQKNEERKNEERKTEDEGVKTEDEERKDEERKTEDEEVAPYKMDADENPTTDNDPAVVGKALWNDTNLSREENKSYIEQMKENAEKAKEKEAQWTMPAVTSRSQMVAEKQQHEERAKEAERAVTFWGEVLNAFEAEDAAEKQAAIDAANQEAARKAAEAEAARKAQVEAEEKAREEEAKRLAEIEARAKRIIPIDLKVPVENFYQNLKRRFESMADLKNAIDKQIGEYVGELEKNRMNKEAYDAMKYWEALRKVFVADFKKQKDEELKNWRKQQAAEERANQDNSQAGKVARKRKSMNPWERAEAVKRELDDMPTNPFMAVLFDFTSKNGMGLDEADVKKQLGVKNVWREGFAPQISKKGRGIEHAAEDICAMYPEMHFDEGEVRDAIIEVLNNYGTKKRAAEAMEEMLDDMLKAEGPGETAVAYKRIYGVDYADSDLGLDYEEHENFTIDIDELDDELKPIEDVPFSISDEGRRTKNEKRKTKDEGQQKLTFNKLSKIARIFGVKVKWDNKLPDNINGYYNHEKKIIFFNPNSKASLGWIFGHELLHRMQDMADGNYQLFRVATISLLGRKEYERRVDAVIETYKNAGHAVADIKAAEEEVTADFAGYLIENGALLDKFVGSLNTKEEYKGVLRTIADFVADFMGKVKNIFGNNSKEMSQLDVACEMLFDLMSAAQQGKVMEAGIVNERLMAEENATNYSIVTDPELIAKLDASEKQIGYRTVVMNEDGTFGSPMADGLRSKGKNKVKTSPFEINKWEQSEENPELVDENGKIDLVKPDGKMVGKVDYNPYIHNRPTKVNKQFKQAWERDNLVYIETEIPVDELNSGYQANKAAKSVGIHAWPTESSKEKLILSRYDKPVRIVPWEEVADDWEKEFKDSGVNFDIVPPALLPILSVRGVEILPPHAGMGEACNEAYEAFKNKDGYSVKVINKKFNEDIDNFEKLPNGYRFELGLPSDKLRATGFDLLPISMRASLVNRKKTDPYHTFDAKDLKNLVLSIQNPIAVFKYSSNNMRNIIVDISKNGKQFLIGITMNFGDVHSVSGLFPKDNHEWIKWIQDDKAIAIYEKDKVQNLIDSLRINPAEAERIGLNLESVAKIVENFKNPTINSEKNAENSEKSRIKLGNEEFDVAELEQNLQDDVESIERNAGYGGESYSITTYHGSAEDFEKFDHAFMGTGEGSHVYGWGTYVSENDGIAKTYADIAIGNKQKSQSPLVYWKGKRVDFSDANPLRMAFDLADDSRTISDARHRAERYAGMAEEQEMKDKWMAALDILNQSKKSDFKRAPKKGNRKLYTVEIPDDVDGNYIDWNASVSERDRKRIADAVIDKLIADKESGYEEKDRKHLMSDLGFEADNIDGGHLYGSVWSALGSEKEASLLLNSLGYVGMKVPTNNMRKGDHSKNNYVIFNEDDLSIAEKESFSITVDYSEEEDVKNGGNILQFGNNTLSLPQQDAEYIRRQTATMPKGSKPWAKDFPDAVIHTTLAKLKKHEDYAAAKAGDYKAALRVVLSAVNLDKVRQICKTYRNAIVAYPHAIEASGKNKLPRAYAIVLKQFGLKVANIATSSEPHHTGSADESRLLRRARFDGEVEAGRDYILLDDQISSGATLRDMKDYIEANGGNVVFISGLTASYGGTKIAPSEQTIKEFAESGITNEQLQQYGIAEGADRLTNAEQKRASRLANSGRNRGSAQRRGGIGQTDGGNAGMQGTQSRGREVAEGRGSDLINYSITDDVESSAFKNWFGDWEKDPENASKVVDADGKPRVVYHGTYWNPMEEAPGEAVFDERYTGTASGDNGFFGRGFYFAFSKEEAQMYAMNGNVLPVYLNIRKPFNYFDELGKIDGMEARSIGFGQNPAIIYNLARKFGELFEDETISMYGNEVDEDGYYEVKQIRMGEFADMMDELIKNTEFEILTTDNEYHSNQTDSYFRVVAGKEHHVEKNGYEWDDYAYDEEWYGKPEHYTKVDFIMSLLDKVGTKDGYRLSSLPDTRVIMQNHDFRAELQKRGHDGIIAGDELVTFESNQIKLSEGNNGEYSTENDDIRYSISAAEAEVDTNPTDAQKKAGNYKMGHVNVDGFDITIENPKGSVRRGVDANGKAWETPMNNTYGYIRGTVGVDGDHIDIFLSDNPAEGNVYVVDQIDPETGTFDEHKVMYGFASSEEAKQAYLSNYEKDWKGLGTITEVSKDDFAKWVASSHRKTKPFADYAMVSKRELNDVDGEYKYSIGRNWSEETEDAYQFIYSKEVDMNREISGTIDEMLDVVLPYDLNGVSRNDKHLLQSQRDFLVYTGKKDAVVGYKDKHMTTKVTALDVMRDQRDLIVPILENAIDEYKAKKAEYAEAPANVYAMNMIQERIDHLKGRINQLNYLANPKTRGLYNPYLDRQVISYSISSMGEPAFRREWSDGSNIFFSNALRAANAVKQDKATPDQWLKMIQNNGGLKAGEDKWIGLSEWIEEQKNNGVKSLTKEEVLNYIADNQIVLEEVRYAEFPSASDERSSESLRVTHTTDGLERKREVALVVPTIEPYKENDEIHFGDAGNGRAVVWVRFGDALSTNIADVDDVSYKKAFDDAHAATQKYEQDMYDKYGIENDGSMESFEKFALAMTEDENAEWNRLSNLEEEAYRKTYNVKRNRVLVIDEIQSKRHQNGRDYGYESKAAKEYDKLEKEMQEKYGDFWWEKPELKKESDRLDALAKKAREDMGTSGTVPGAPFEKNWMEIAFKRMIRYAAENDYSKIAWTTGTQQAMRYDIAKMVNRINVFTDRHPAAGEEAAVKEVMFVSNGDTYRMKVNRSGVVVGNARIGNSVVEGKHLSEVFGKELAEEIMQKNGEHDMIEIGGRIIGGEGMKAFYDKMIPSYVQKYVKKWGASVGEVELDLPKEESRKMWAIDVTDEMKKSVLEGQPLFRRINSENYDHTPAEADAIRAKVAELEERFGVKLNVRTSIDEVKNEKARIEISAQETLRKNGKRWGAAKAWFDKETGEVEIYLPYAEGVEDVTKTILHEVVGHRGLREILSQSEGEWISVMMDIYDMLPSGVQNEIMDAARNNGYNIAAAVDEYLADKAMEEYTPTWWSRVAAVLSNMLRNLGIDIVLNENDVKYMLWRSRKTLENKGNDSVVDMAENAAMRWQNGIGKYMDVEKLTNNPAYRFVGKVAESFTNYNRIEKADAMEKAGYTAAKIKYATGCERGADGEWRLEMPDDYSNAPKLNPYNPYLENADGMDNVVNLKDVVSGEGEKLLAEYPGIGDITIQFVNDESKPFVGQMSGGCIFINEPKLHTDMERQGIEENEENYNMHLQGVIAHEIQHIIQYAEGFASGGSVALSDKVTMYYFEKQPLVVRSMALTMSDEMMVALANREANMDEVKGVLEERMNENSEDTPIGRMTRMIYDSVVNQSEEELAMMAEKAIEGKSWLMLSPMEVYERMMGEVEARNVMKRYGWSYEQIVSTLGLTTEDILRSQQIRLDKNVMMEMSDGGRKTKDEERRTKNEEQNGVQYSITSKFEDPDVIARKMMEDEINRLNNEVTSLRKKLGRKDDIEDAKRQAIATMRDNINSEVGQVLNSLEIRGLINSIENAKTAAKLDAALDKVTAILQKAQLRYETQRLDKLLKTRLRVTDTKGVAQGKVVDNATRERINAMKGTFKQLLITHIDDELSKMRNSKLKMHRQLKEATLPTADRIAIEQMLEELNGRIDAAIEEQDALRKDVSAETDEQLAVRKAEIEDLLMRDPENVSEAMMEELRIIEYKSKVVAMLKTQQEMEYRNKHAKELGRIAESARSKEERARLKTESDMEYAAYKMAQRKLIDETRELADAIKQLLEEGQDKFIAHKDMMLEHQRDVIRIGVNAVKRWEQLPPNTPEHELGNKRKKHEEFQKGWFKKFIDKMMEPLNSFDFVVQVMSINDIPGEGELYNMLVSGKNGVMAAYDKRNDGIKAQRQEIDERIKDIFGENYDLQRLLEESNDKKYLIDLIHTHDTESHRAGTTKNVEMTKGEMLYAWLCWRQPDARKKMEAVGWTEASIEEIENYVGSKYLEFAEWLTEDYLPKTREERYNPVHVDAFGTSLARGEHYFPLRVYQPDVERKAGIDDVQREANTGMTPGNIIERTVHNHRIDTSHNAFGVLIKYINDMETWAAYTPVCADINILLKNKAFMNALENNHKGLSEIFRQAAQVATLNYIAPKQSEMNDFVAKIQRLWAGSKISWRFFTAMKQLFSYPVFHGYAMDMKFQMELLANQPFLPHNMVKNYKWAVENLPGFRDRIEKGSTGLEILEREGFDMGDAMQRFTNLGMLPNKTIDAITVACGARCVYNLEKRIALKNGNSEEEAHQYAVVMAEIAFNRSQQSSNPAFLSPKQKSKNVVDIATTAFQNSNIGFTRSAMIGVLMMKRSQPYSKQWRAGLGMVLANTMIAQVGWTLGGSMFDWGTKAALWMLSDSDDDNEQVFSDELIWSMLVSGLISPVRGTTAGNWLDAVMNGNDYTLLSGMEEMLTFVNDIKTVIDKTTAEDAEKDGELLDSMGKTQVIGYEIGKRLALVVTNAYGINPETYANMVLGAWDACERGRFDLIDFMLIINAPRSSRREVVKALGHDMDNPEEFAQRMGVALSIYDEEETVRGSQWMPATKPLTDGRYDMIMDMYYDLKSINN